MYVGDPHGRDAKKFRTLFRVPYDLFVDLVQISKERWWHDWTPDKVCNAGKACVELRVEGTGSAVCSRYRSFPGPGWYSNSPERRGPSSFLLVVVVEDVFDLVRVHLYANDGSTIRIRCW